MLLFAGGQTSGTLGDKLPALFSNFPKESQTRMSNYTTLKKTSQKRMSNYTTKKGNRETCVAFFRPIQPPATSQVKQLGALLQSIVGSAAQVGFDVELLGP